MSTHIESSINDISKTVLMPGDPKRCEYIAKKYLTNAKIINNVRGMTAYSGYYKSKFITIFPSGMGIPSMGIYSYELFKEYNVDNIIRIGTMGSYTNLALKDIVLVENSITNSNYGKYLCNYQNITIESNNEINKIIEYTSNELNIKITKGNIYSSDVFYEGQNNYQEKVRQYNVLGVEMESFALFITAKLLRKKATAILMVSDSFNFTNKLTSKEREQSLDNLIILALEASLKI